MSHFPRVVVVVGVRPHFIKAGPLVQALRHCAEISVIHTGQHYDYELTAAHVKGSGLPDPERALDIGPGSPAGQVGIGLIQIEAELRSLSPQLVLSIGDANTSVIGAIGASQMGIPVCHLEAGVRKAHGTWIIEEVNRRLIDSVSELCLTPTKTKQAALAASMAGDERQRARFVGDVLLDSAMRCAVVSQPSDLTKWVQDQPRRGTILVTLHRRETLEDSDGLRCIVSALLAVRAEVVLMAHPRTARRLQEVGLLEELERSPWTHVLPACPHEEMIRRIAGADVTVTDSSGVQREAYFLGRPALIVRDDTEYPETVSNGCSAVIGPRAEGLQAAAEAVSGQAFEPDYDEFGGGRAAERTADEVARFLGSG